MRRRTSFGPLLGYRSAVATGSDLDKTYVFLFARLKKWYAVVLDPGVSADRWSGSPQAYDKTRLDAVTRKKSCQNQRA
jgi:hypothetical protein